MNFDCIPATTSATSLSCSTLICAARWALHSLTKEDMASVCEALLMSLCKCCTVTNLLTAMCHA